MQLVTFRGKFHLVAAMKINEGLPIFLTKLEQKMSLKNKKIGILGMAFKVKQMTYRLLSIKLRNYLHKRGFKFYCSDPYFKDKQIIN